MHDFRRWGDQFQQITHQGFFFPFFNSTGTNCPIWLPFKEVTDWCLEKWGKKAKGVGPSLVISWSCQVSICLMGKWVYPGMKGSQGASRNCHAKRKVGDVFLLLDNGAEP